MTHIYIAEFMFCLIEPFVTYHVSSDEHSSQVCIQMKSLLFFLFSGTSRAEGSSLAVCSSSLSPAVGILPVLPLPQCGILPQQGSRSSRPSFCPWEQQGPDPTVPSNRALQGKTYQVRNNTHL